MLRFAVRLALWTYFLVRLAVLFAIGSQCVACSHSHVWSISLAFPARLLSHADRLTFLLGEAHAHPKARQ